jgi:hypothetical protein
LGDEGYELTNRDRLRPLYGLKLQQDFGNHILRVGPPIMPPVHMPMRGELFLCTDEQTTPLGVLEKDELYSSWFKGKLTVRITPSIAGQLRRTVEDLLIGMKDRLDELKTAEQDDRVKKAVKSLEPKVTAITNNLAKDESWIRLLGDQELPSSLEKKTQGLYFVRGAGWTRPSDPAIVFQITDPTPAEGGTKQSDGSASLGVEESIAVAVEATDQLIEAVNVDAASGDNANGKTNGGD